jgi:hypothetical protein
MEAKYKKSINQIGGENIFDISNNNYPEYKKGKLIYNISKLYKKYGSKFSIKMNDIILPVKLVKIKLHNGVKFFRLIYDIEHRTTRLTPIIIDFIDPIKAELNNFSYIANIQKTNDISGTNLVKICLTINRILGAQKTYLGDGTEVLCNKNNQIMDLSYIKLIERGTTFYMNLGFDFEITNYDWFYNRFSSTKDLKKEIYKLLKKIRTIKTITLIKEYEDTLSLIVNMIKNDYEGTFEILNNNSNASRISEIYVNNPYKNITEIFDECKIILEILNRYKNIDKFYIILVKTFREACDDYTLLNKYIMESNRTKIIYNKSIIKRNYVIDFDFLKRLRYSFYSYTFF